MSDAFWNTRYAEPGFAYGTQPNDFLAEMTPRLPKGRALCLAEGEGRNAVHLARHGFEVTALDLSSVGLNKAQELARQNGVTLTTVVANLQDYAFPVDHFDVVVSIWCHIPNPLRTQVHRAAARSLRPGGMVVLEAYTPAQLGFSTGGPKDPALLMNLVDLRQELAPLVFLHGVERVRDVHEGTYHQGQSAVVQVLAQRPK